MSNILTNRPPGWPAHLHAYDPGRHRPRLAGGVAFHPYDHTPARVKSYVAIAGDGYLGIVTADRDQPFQAIPANGGRSAFPRTLLDASRFLLSAVRR